MSRKLTAWQRAAAGAVEGLYFLAWLLLRLAESGCLLTAGIGDKPWVYGVAAGVGITGRLLLAPLRLGRWLWYDCLHTAPHTTPAFSLLFAGYKRAAAAMLWRWGVWWRQASLLLVGAFPAALLWGYGDRLSRLGEPTGSLLWMVLGGVALLGGVAFTLLRRGRYKLAPLLLARGCPASLAIPLSVRLTRGHTGRGLDFWFSRLRNLLLCLLPGGMFWAVPPLRAAYLAELDRWLGAVAQPLSGTRRVYG